jgi:hypothetical protein
VDRVIDFFRSFLLVELFRGMALTGRHLFRAQDHGAVPEERRR